VAPWLAGVPAEIVPHRKTYLGRLKLTIEQLHGCAAHHRRTVRVKEVIHGKARDVEVEVFDLIGHVAAKRCYGWSHAVPEAFTTVLGMPPVDSSQSAVKVAVA
jgi:hypothetical protein